MAIVLFKSSKSFKLCGRCDLEAIQALLNPDMNFGDEPVAKALPVWNLDRRFIASFSNAEFVGDCCFRGSLEFT